jgi:hypothetical protein
MMSLSFGGVREFLHLLVSQFSSFMEVGLMFGDKV